MIKKLLLTIPLLIFVGTSYSYDINKIKSLYSKKLDKIKQKIEQKYDLESKICKETKNKYITLNNALSKYFNKFKAQKNGEIFFELIKITNKKIKTFPKDCIKNNTNKKILNLQEKNIENNNKNLGKIKINLDEKYLNQDGKIHLTSKKYKIPNKKYIEEIYDNFYFKVDGQWLLINSFKKVGINKQYVGDYLQNINKDKNFYYKKTPDSYVFYIFKKKDVQHLGVFSPKKSLEENTNNLKNGGFILFDNFLYKDLNKDGILISGIVKYYDKLYYISSKNKGKYYLINNDFFLYQIQKFDKTNLFTKYNNKIVAWESGINKYYLGNYNMYKDIDIEKMGEILKFSFQVISKYDLKYNFNNMYKLIKFTKRFENQEIKDIYKWITSNIEYNKKIKKLLNDKNFNRESFKDLIVSNKKYFKNWNTFYGLDIKQGNCQTMSDLLSITSLFYGKDSDIISGITVNGYGHQVSKIGNYYYDPTYDLNSNGSFEYFKITKKDLEKYFKNNE